jgi:hypothetical protein
MGWLGMLAVIAVVPFVITTQRPRPSYLFALSVFLMAVTGMSLFVITRHWRRLHQTQCWFPLSALTIVFLVPSYFQPQSGDPQRPLHDLARRLKPFGAEVIRPKAKALLGDYCFELSAYVWNGRCEALDYGPILHDSLAGTSLESTLDERNIDLLYLNERILLTLEQTRPELVRALLRSDLPRGWLTLGSGDTPGDRWRLYRRASPEPEQNESEAKSGVPPWLHYRF